MVLDCLENFKMENHLENECVKHEINCPFSGDKF